MLNSHIPPASAIALRRTAMLVPHMNAESSRLLPAMIGPKNSVCWSQATRVTRFWSWFA